MAEPTVYTEPADSLIVGVHPAAAITSVELAPGQDLKRGTLLAASDTGYVIMDTAAAGKPAYILCDDVTTDDTDKTPAEVYRSGCFAESAIIVKDGYTLTDEDKDALRKYDIILAGDF